MATYADPKRPRQTVIRSVAAAAAALLLALTAVPAVAGEVSVQLTTSAASEAVKWYQRHLDCEPIEGRGEAIDCGKAVIEFTQGPIMGASQGTGLDHISFSFPDLTEKMAELEKVGVRGSGVRLQRFDDGSTLRDIPGLFKIGFIFDPWGTRIEVVEGHGDVGLPPCPPQFGRSGPDTRLVPRDVRRRAGESPRDARRPPFRRRLAARLPARRGPAGAERGTGDRPSRLRGRRSGHGCDGSARPRRSLYPGSGTSRGWPVRSEARFRLRPRQRAGGGPRTGLARYRRDGRLRG